MPDSTIKDVARLANVSIATVSRVINNESGIRPKTLEKVRKAIAETHYVPNASAQNLKNDKTHIIGLLISDISNTHFTSMAKVMEKILRSHGYSIVVCNTDDDPALELEYLHRLMSLRVDGLILNTSNQNNEYITQLSHMIPIVLIERCIENSDFSGDYISSNNYAGVYSMTRYLIDNGHRKIGIINTNLCVSTGKERLSGFVDAMHEVGIEVNERYPYRYDSKFFNMEGGIQGCQCLMQLEDRPTAIIVTNNTMALGVYKYLHIHQFSIPDDVSVLSYGTLENHELMFVNPSYTTLNPQFIGERAAKSILSRIENPHINNREIVFEPLLTINESVRAI